MIRWDLAECERITRHNTLWVAYWGQCRLIHWMRDRILTAQTLSSTDAARPTKRVAIFEDHAHLKPLRTCSMMIKDMMALSVDFHAI
ncbi:hypothetical protein V8C35DRAFT_319214 [Trichoderma chlorosporum]